MYYVSLLPSTIYFAVDKAAETIPELQAQVHLVDPNYDLPANFDLKTDMVITTEVTMEREDAPQEPSGYVSESLGDISDSSSVSSKEDPSDKA